MASDGAADTRQLEWEAAQRPRAAIAAAAAGVLMLGGSVYSSVGLTARSVGVVQGLAPALKGIPDPHVDPRTATVISAAHHSGRIIPASIISAIAIALIPIVLTYVYSAVKARRPELPNVARNVSLVAPLVVAVAGMVGSIVLSITAHNFANGTDRSRHAVDQVFASPGIIAVQLLALLGSVALAYAVITISLNAMRVGLLTRFMGIIGVLSGVLLFAGPLFGLSLPVVQAFWLVALGFVLSGRNPTGLPPAWEAGRAIPWPSQQQLREQRMQARAGGGGAADEPPEPVAPQSQQGGSGRRKRKRR